MQSNTPHVVIFQHNNVAIKRKKMYPSPDYSNIGNKDNAVCLYVEGGKTYIKVVNLNTGRVYMLSLVQSMTNSALNQNNPRGVHLNLVNFLLKPRPAIIFLFVTPLPDYDMETSEEELVDKESLVDSDLNEKPLKETWRRKKR